MKAFLQFIVLSFLYFFPVESYSCTTMSPNGARLYNNRVNVWVSSSGTCADANTSGEQLLTMARQAVDQFWNKISGSRLHFVVAGYWENDVVRFETGELCTPGVDCNNSTVPNTTEVIIACNDNTDNFSATTYAKTSIVVDGAYITGANILLNNTTGSIFGDLTDRQKLWVLAHELGHAAGLGHSKNPANLMYYTLTPDRLALGEEDYWGMSYLYAQNHDGCGLIGSIRDQSKNKDETENGPWWSSFLIGFSFLIFLVLLQKVFLKRFKFIS